MGADSTEMPLFAMAEVGSVINNRDFRKEFVGLSFLALGLSVSSTLFLPLGAFLSFFTPMPLMVTFFLFGKNRGVISTGAVLLGVVAISGLPFGMIFLVQYGFMAFLAGTLPTRGFSVEKSLTLSALAPVAIGVAMLFLFIMGSDSTFIEVMDKAILFNIDSLLATYKEMGVTGEQVEYLRANKESLSRQVVAIIPSVLLLFFLVIAFINYGLAKYIVQKRYSVKMPWIKPLEGLLLPEPLVWILIGSGILLLVSSGALAALAFNTIVVGLFFYFLQGMGVVSFFTRKWKNPPFVKAGIYFFIFVQPLLMILVAGVGLFDIWFDFRRLRSSEVKKEEK